MSNLTMSRFPPPPDAGPAPRMWKSLGVVAQSMGGYIEAHYELKTFDGDLDIDSEQDVRDNIGALLASLQSVRQPLDPSRRYTLQRRRGLLQVRFASSGWGEAHVANFTPA